MPQEVLRWSAEMPSMPGQGGAAVTDASACGLLQTARRHSRQIGKVYAGWNRIIGVPTEDLIDTSIEPETAIAALKHTPGGPLDPAAINPARSRSIGGNTSG